MPPGIENSWDDCNVAAHAHLIAYNQIRDYEDEEKEDHFYNFFAGTK